jgi:hypothetical protein
MTTTTLRRTLLGVGLMAALMLPQEANAQLDPLLYLKPKPGGVGSGDRPTVLIAVDTAIRMQRDTNGDYRDPNQYKYADPLLVWEAALGINPANTSSRYRRKYVGLTEPSNSPHEFTTDHIEIVGDTPPSNEPWTNFDEYTRLSIARRGLIEVVRRNTGVVRFGLIRTRQNSPMYETPISAEAWTWKINESPVTVRNNAWPLQQADGDAGGGQWKITRSVVGSVNGSITNVADPNYSLLVKADVATSNPDVLARLTAPANYLLPAGRDTNTSVDAPVDTMLDDLRSEATRLGADCRNIVAVLVVGGGRGGTSTGDLLAKAKTFLSVGASSRRVPIHVIAIAPVRDVDRTQLTAVANISGGQYTEIDATMVDPTTVGAGKFVPEFVRAVNYAVSQSFADQGDLNSGLSTTHQVTSPIIGTVNLENGKDINGNPLPNTVITHPVTGTEIPQRSNIIITTGFTLPGFSASMHAARVYRPVADSSKTVGYKFVSDGTKLWEASTPDAASRNIYTALPNGTVVAFTTANAGTLLPYLLKSSDATALGPAKALDTASALIDYIRLQPLGAIVDSTPAIMDPPSLDPPPDADYPEFVDENKDRRSMIWVGANDGMLHGIDSRLGKEVWAFIPFNLLPKLSTLRSGQPVGDFRFFVDGSPKVADVKIGGQWRSYLVMGEGPGGTFYQTFDVTLANMGQMVSPTSDNLAQVLSYFSSASSVPLKWAFPQYQHFDYSCSFSGGNCPALSPWGDIATGAPSIAKTVGETWSDPAVGQIGSPSSPFVVLTGSGFLKYSIQKQPNRGGTVAGTTFYVLDVATGNVLDSRKVISDPNGETGPLYPSLSTADNCAAANNCTLLKNALQADPVATGPADSRYITKAYLGDLDGQIWRFDLNLNASGAPVITQMLNLYTISTGAGSKASDHPIFSSMATVSIGNSQQYLFVGTGSDLLPSNGINVQYGLFVILDQGATGMQTALIKLAPVDGAGDEEKVSSFPAVAGDIVFFSTTSYKTAPNPPCTRPDGNLYAFTFIGGPAYDTDNDGKLTANKDTPKVKTTTGARATSPFIVDQHLVFGAGNGVQILGDSQDFNNGVGQAGVRILSWREVR